MRKDPLITVEVAMTGEEFLAARRALGLNRYDTAKLLGYSGSQHRQQIIDMETGQRPIREPQRRLIQAYLEGYRPQDWPLQGQ